MTRVADRATRQAQPRMHTAMNPETVEISDITDRVGVLWYARDRTWACWAVHRDRGGVGAL
ncbi:hypothetical protein GCM10009574_059830 [Streptomyces asiaticus]|uniref:Uncharacterized protein n=2 Tax=Streptomyces rhizosphaericus TaxID=114699 RepID=A0ABN1P7S7_9ACTN